MNKGLSTYEEIKSRKDPRFVGELAQIHEICPSTIREDTFIITFLDGSQSNVNEEVKNKLTK